MNEDQAMGVGQNLKGKVNEAVGKVTNDPAQEKHGVTLSRLLVRPASKWST